MSEHVTHVDDNSFESEVTQAETPVLVDFYAEWCGPCKMLGPIVEEVSADYVGKVKFVKVNVDNSPESAQKYGVRGIPTLIIFKQGEAVETKVGALTKSQLISFIDSAV